MSTRGHRAALARYVNLIAGGAEVSHSQIAAQINSRNPGARVAGPLVGRWRHEQIDISPGNLAALARAYDRNPLEAFIVAGLLELEEAEAGIDAESRKVIDIVWSDEVVIDFESVRRAIAPDPSHKMPKVAKKSEEQAGAPEE